jgi:predicted alpha/beta-hydrolase family hydrolase
MASPEARGRLGVGGADVGTLSIRPAKPVATLVVAHGAGAGMDHPFMAGFCRAMGDAGIATLRFNFPYVERGRRSPDPERVLRETWLAAFDEASAGAGGGSVFVGGKSLGGRLASMCVADGMAAAGLVFLGYPLHPPGKPERARDEHLYRIDVPMLFLQGTADPFANADLLARVVRKLGDRATLERIEGGDHSFNVRGRKADPREVGAGLAGLAAPFVERVVRTASRKTTSGRSR